MSLEAIKKVTETEQDTQTRKAEAAATAKKLVTDADKAGRELVESARREAEELVKGFMIESYLEDGNQPVDGGVFGKSITDPCLGWEKTDYLIHEIAERI